MSTQPANPLHQFTPHYSRDFVTDQVREYARQPDLFRDDYLTQLESHARHYGIPFSRDPEEMQFNLWRALGEVGEGFVSGFTGGLVQLGDKEPAANPYERIAHSIGHLGGFVGFIPGTGMLGSAAMKTAGIGGKILSGTSKLAGHSLPMVVANKLTKPMAKGTRALMEAGAKSQTQAIQRATKYLLDTPLAGDIAKGAFHLGAASAVDWNTWQHGVDETLKSFGHGALFGGVFRGLGNVVKTGSDVGDKAVRALAGSVFDGLPSTLAKQTTEEQVYHYLMGAYFGWKEMPYEERAFKEFQREAFTKDEWGKTRLEEMESFQEVPEHLKPIVEHEYFKDAAHAEAQAGLYQAAKTLSDELQTPLEQPKNLQEQAPRRGQVGTVQPGVAEITTGPEVSGMRQRVVADVWEQVRQPRTELTDPGEARLIPQPVMDIVRDQFATEFVETAASPFEVSKLLYERTSQVYGALEHFAPQSKRDPIRSEMFEEWWRATYPEQPLDRETAGMFRQMLASRKHDSQVPIISEVGGTVNVLSTREGKIPTTSLGDMKDLREPTRLVEEIYWNARRRTEGAEADFSGEERPLFLHDHFIRTLPKTKQQVERSITDQLRAYEQEFQQFPGKKKVALHQEKGWGDISPAEGARRYAQEQLDRDFANIAWQMFEQHNALYFGGQGDAERNLFVKMHPEVERTSPKVFQAIKRTLIEQVEGGEQTWTQERQAFTTMMEAAGVRTGDAHKLFDAHILNNVYYTLEMNGKSQFGSLQALQDAVREVTGPGFINDPVKFNKRQKIWFTNGIPAEGRFIREHLLREQGEQMDLVDGKFRALIVETPEDRPDYAPEYVVGKHSALDRVQVRDGYITVRDDILQALNREAGKAEDLAQLKNFIISQDPNLGTLLAKHEMKSAGEAQSDAMRKAGLHMLIPTTAAKQTGHRRQYRAEFDPEAAELVIRNTHGNRVKRGEAFTLAPEDIRNIYSEVTAEKFTSDQHLPKQMQALLTPFAHSPIEDGTITEFLHHHVTQDVAGDPAWNRRMETALKPDANPADRAKVIENLDKVGLELIFKAVRQEGRDEFATQLLKQLMKVDAETQRLLQEEGELAGKTVTQYVRNLQSSNSGTERLLKLEQNLSAYLHPQQRNYRETVLRNYAVRRATRPKVRNSMVARLDPLDIELIHRVAGQRVNGNERLFLLDDSYREKVLTLDFDPRTGKDVDHTVRMKFGELWDQLQQKDLPTTGADRTREFLQAVVPRVPMDSLSGAQVLEFGGFTGRKGYGVVMHARAMEQIGGADLDGDKAYLFFGWKQPWREMYDRQRNEYVETRGDQQVLPDTKASTLNGERVVERFADAGGQTNVIQMFSPVQRRRMAESAMSGRAQLGSNVITQQTLLNAHVTIARNPDAGVLDMGEVRTRLIPKTDPEALEAFRKIAHTAIGVSMDPMNFARIETSEVFFKQMFRSLFAVEQRTADGKVQRMSVADAGVNFLRQETAFRQFKQVNDALFSKNYREDRPYTMSEIQDALAGLGGEGETPAYFPTVARALRHVNWEDSIFRRMDREGLSRLYEMYWEAQQQGKFTEAAQVLGRVNEHGLPQVTVKPHAPLFDFIFEHQLWDRPHRQYVARTKAKDVDRLFRQHAETFGWKDGSREFLLEQITRTGEELFFKDLADMTTWLKLRQLVAHMTAGVSEAERPQVLAQLQQRVTEDLLPRVSQLKSDSYLKAKATRQAERTFRQTESGETVAPEKGSSLQNQVEIDQQILRAKQDLPPREQQLFDVLMLGSVESYTRKTQTSQLGVNSQAVSDGAIRYYYDTLDQLLRSTLRLTESPTPTDPIMAELKQTDRVLTPEGPQKSSLFPETDSQRAIDAAIAGIEIQRRPKVDDDPLYYARGLSGEPQTKRGKALANQISEIAGQYKLTAEEFNGFVEGVVGKSLNSARMTMHDVEVIANTLKSMRDGTVFQRLFEGDAPLKDDVPNLTRFLYYMFPRAVDERWLRYDMKFVTKKAPVLVGTRTDPVLKDVKYPTHTLGRLQEFTSRTQQGMDREREQVVDKDVENAFRPLESVHGVTHRNFHGGDFWNVLIAGREYGRWAGRKDMPEGMVNVLNRTEMDPSARKRQQDMYRENWREVEAEYALMQDATVRSVFNEQHTAALRELGHIGSKETVRAEGKQITMTGKEFIQVMDRTLTHWVQRVQEGPYQGDPAKLERYRNADGSLDIRQFEKEILEQVMRGEPLDVFTNMNFGLKGLNELMKQLMLETAEDPAIRTAVEQMELHEPKTLPAEFYWHHTNHNRKQMGRELQKAVKRELEDTNLTDNERMERVQQLLVKHRGMTGEWMFDNLKDWAEYDQLVDAVRRRKTDTEEIRHETWQVTPGAALKRGTHMPGYDTSPEAFKQYVRKMISANYRQISQILNRITISEFRKEQFKRIPDTPEHRELINNWENFFKLFAQDAMGYPAIIPSHVSENPGMKLKGTLYKFVADNETKRRIEFIRDKLGLGDTELPKDLRELDYDQLKKWSNLEAKYELMSLLAHPKTAIANLFGGTTLSMISVGPRNLRKARNIDYLRNTLSPDITSKKDLDQLVAERGVVEEFIAREAGAGTGRDAAKWQRFREDVARRLTRNPEMEDRTLREIAKQYGITDNLFQKAAWFMRKTERVLRRDAYIAHLVQAYERFGGAIKDPLHNDYLHEIAKRGVQTTQFLYNNAHRPAFARTALGKVFARFQLWAWNSVRFRKDVLNEAATHGFQPGTQAFERYKRLMIADIFALGLGNMFLSSMFENQLPAPLSWMQDTADWLFGDSEERDRAFFGAYPTALAPLQMVTPPAARLLPPMFKAMVDDEYGRIADYYVWTMFPFGRLARDVVKSAENPMMTVNKLTGFPYVQLQRELFDRTRDEEEDDGTGTEIRSGQTPLGFAPTGANRGYREDPHLRRPEIRR